MVRDLLQCAGGGQRGRLQPRVYSLSLNQAPLESLELLGEPAYLLRDQLHILQGGEMIRRDRSTVKSLRCASWEP